MEHVAIFDTTLRDGEQSPGASMSVEQKYEIAAALSRLGVDVIEAGFPVSSPQQFEACKLIAERISGVTVTALARALDADIESAAEAVKKAERKRIHGYGVISNRSTYEIMTPESVGREDTNIVLGRHSGLHGFTRRLKDLGLELDDDERKLAYERFLDLAYRKREVYDDDLYAIISDQLGRKAGYYELEYFNVTTGNVSIPTSTIKIRRGEEILEEAATGDGPIDAIFLAIDKATGVQSTLKEYNVQAVTPGKQALGEVAVILEIEGTQYTGRGSSTDILLASAKAYINAVSRYKLQSQSAEESA
jgi:isopropylmalate/homocitrate/citramalate synthase